MSQAPRWRYSRKTVSAMEKALTLLVLGILAGLSGLFLWDMKNSAVASPFTVETKLLSDAARPPESVAAGYLLPTSAVAKRLNSPQALTMQDLTEKAPDLATLAKSQKPKRVLTATYDIAATPAVATVLDCETPDRAQDLWTARKPAQAKTIPVGGAGQAWRTDSQAAFAAGKYYVELATSPGAAGGQAASAGVSQAAQSSDPVTILLGELSRAHVFSKPVTAAQAATSQSVPPAQEGPLPKLAGPDITGPAEVRRFNQDTLYEKIDGKAQLYLSYNFTELLFTTYTAGDLALDVYVYDMSQADNAFGIFKAEQSEQAEPAAVGKEGYFSGSSVFFWKGKYYVNVLAAAGEGGSEEAEPGASSDTRPTALKLATALAQQMPDAGQSLWAEQVLPTDNRVPGTFEFRKSDAFGLDFLKDVFSAQYKTDDKDLTLFVTRAASPQAAQDLLKQYQDFTSKYGKIIENADIAGGKALVAENTGTFDVVFAKGPYFGGVTAADNKDLAKTTITKWLEGMTR